MNPQEPEEKQPLIPETPEQPIENTPEPANMEVHHHAHHDHGKRSWKTYFWEFLMLFLAVLCGFLAESYHTHLVNKGIEKRNIESFISAIQRDSINLSASIERCKTKINTVDTLAKIPGNFLDTAFQQQFFKYALALLIDENYKPEESAFLQMQSSGTLRLIEKQNITDSILKYQTQNTTIKKQMDFVNENFSLAKDNLVQITDFRKAALKFNGNTQQIQNYINYKIIEAAAINGYIFHLQKQLNTATNLIPFLKKEYDIE